MRKTVVSWGESWEQPGYVQARCLDASGKLWVPFPISKFVYLHGLPYCRCKWMWWVEQPDVSLQECQVHQHGRFLQVFVSARLRALGQTQLLHAIEYRLEFRKRQWPGVKENLRNLSPYTLHCVKEEKEMYYTWDIAPNPECWKYGNIMELPILGRKRKDSVWALLVWQTKWTFLWKTSIYSLFICKIQWKRGGTVLLL